MLEASLHSFKSLSRLTLELETEMEVQSNREKDGLFLERLLPTFQQFERLIFLEITTFDASVRLKR